MLKLLSGLVCLGLAMSGPAIAGEPIATLSGVQGKVLVNHGKGFVMLQEPTSLNLGDQIFVGAGAQAVLSYLDQNCSVVLDKANRITISTNVPCKTGDNVAAVDGVFITPVNSVYDAAPVIDSNLLIAGSLGVLAIGSLTYVLLKDKGATATCTPTAISACP